MNNELNSNTPISPLSKIMGILNLTPNSFSDGSLDIGKAYEKAYRLLEDGADFIDIGAEATNPKAIPIDEDTEWARLSPLLDKLIHSNFPMDKVSIDTYKESIALKAIDKGISFINSEAGLFSDSFFTYIQSSILNSDLKYCSMFVPPTLLNHSNVIDQTNIFFNNCYNKLKDFGFSHDRIFLDYGIGFNKTDSAILYLINQTSHFSSKYNLLVGMSRKSFIYRLLSIDPPLKRDDFTKGVEFGLLSCCSIIRTHNVKTLNILRSTLREEPTKQ